VATYPGIDGFLGTRASFMLDFVVLAMVGILPVLGWSVWQAKRGRYLLHKRVQLALAAVLAVAVALFEIDMRTSGWRPRAEASPYYGTDGAPGIVDYALAVHLFFAVTTVVLWITVIVRALRRFPNPPRPNEHSPQHILWAKLAAADMAMTAVTGWLFYYLAFVA
jgi:uncharacterized membrane protein YozB (DUF420 family)